MNYRTVFHNLGNILMIESLFMLLPLLTAAVYREKTGFSFAVTAAFTFAAGMLLVRLNANPDRLRAREGFVIVGLSWILISLAGAFPFYLSGEIPSFTNALFESVSGFTTTGVTVVSNVEELSRCILIWRSLSHWLGGMGILVFMLAVLPLRAGNTIHLLRAESSGPSVSKIMPRMQSSASVLYLIYISLTLIEAVLLKLGGMSVFDSLLYAMSTAGTGGFSTHTEGVAVYGSSYIYAVITVFMVLFGLNFNVYFLLLMRKPKEVFRKTEVRIYFLLFFLAAATIALSVYHIYGSAEESIIYSAFMTAAFMTSTGFSVTDYTIWPLYPKIMLLLLAIVGSCAGSTCGSLKISRIVILAKTAFANLRRLSSPRSVKSIKMDGKNISKETISDVHAFVTIYMMVLIVSAVLLSLDSDSLSTAISAAIAALSNVGIGFGSVGTTGDVSFFSPFSKYVLCFNMLAGRLEIFPVLLLLMPATWKKY